MNTETGEIRNLTTEEMAQLNAEELSANGREPWVSLQDWKPRSRREKKMLRFARKLVDASLEKEDKQ